MSMKMIYAYIKIPEAGMIKFVPYVHIHRATRVTVIKDVWMVPAENARSRQVGRAELLALAQAMGSQVFFGEETVGIKLGIR